MEAPAFRPRSTDRAMSALSQQHWSASSLPDVDCSSGPIPSPRRKSRGGRRLHSYTRATQLATPTNRRRSSGGTRVSRDLNRHSQQMASMSMGGAPAGGSRVGPQRSAPSMAPQGWAAPANDPFPLTEHTRPGRPSLSRELNAGRMPLLSDISWAPEGMASTSPGLGTPMSAMSGDGLGSRPSSQRPASRQQLSPIRDPPPTADSSTGSVRFAPRGDSRGSVATSADSSPPIYGGPVRPADRARHRRPEALWTENLWAMLTLAGLTTQVHTHYEQRSRQHSRSGLSSSGRSTPGLFKEPIGPTPGR